jgi:D-alanyl-D-alanine carboxypeptidase (penicillin-binding protein 5/6)
MIELFLSLLLSWQSLDSDTISTPTQIIKLDSSRPKIQGSAGLIADLNTNTILYQKNSLTHFPIASLTKLMTALIILEEHKLNEIVTIAPQSTQVGGSIIGLIPNEEITILSLLKGLLIQSGNDVAIALALHNSQTVEAFVEKMNSKASNLNLQSTKFSNPMGFDDADNFSTAQDLYILAKTVYEYDIVKEIVNTKEETIYSTNKLTQHDLQTTNLILDNYLNIGGLKTGTTSQAGGCFIGITKNNKTPHIAIILGSNDRFLDTKVMLDWAKNTFTYKNL